MYDLFFYISRFVFLAIMGLFLAAGLYYLKLRHAPGNTAALRECGYIQQVCILLIHILSYSVILWSPGSTAGDTERYITAGSFFFIVAAFVLSALVYRKSCRLIINCVLFLMNIGLIMITRLDPESAAKQLIWFVFGFALFLALPLILKIIPKSDKLSLLYLFAGGALIVSPFFIGTTINGATNWILFNISGFAFSFQPSEGVKFLFVFYLACVFRRERDIKGLILPFCAAAGFVLILVLQRDLGGALIFFVTFMGMFYVGTGNLAFVGVGFAAFSFAAYTAYRLFSHIQVRIAAWTDPWADITNTGWQIAQSLFAIGTWGPFGAGLNRGLPGSIPAAETDFIFAAISEEYGIIFGLCLIAVYLLIFARSMSVSIHASERYHSMLAAGFAFMLMFQTFLIIGGNTRFIPLTGVTLPLVSYGGSSVAVSLLMIGIIEWVASRKAAEGAVSEEDWAGGISDDDGREDDLI